MDQPQYHSKFGGLWIDRADWRQRMSALELSANEIANLTQFVQQGYIIFENAVSLDAIDAFQKEVERSFREGNDKLLYQTHGDQTTRPLDHAVDRLGTRVVDSFVALPQALKLFSTPRLVSFLQLIFAEDPLLFQSLSFDQGSQQGLHQDTAYVVVNRPLELAAVWIALEDVKPGSGELMYSPGSHRLPDWDFGGNKKHWNSVTDGDQAHADWAAFLRAEAGKPQHRTETFLPRKGDMLIWHADLAHGGSPVENTDLTRQSLVGHFCPQSARPSYFDNGGRSTVHHYGRLAYSSGHYDLAAAEPVA
jgi:phytanoyl-CoA hydroxylase